VAQTESNPIKRNQTCQGRELACRWQKRVAAYGPVKPSQTRRAWRL
jgi:hypothetical protein